MWKLISLIFISVLFLPNIQVTSNLFLRVEDLFIFIALITIILKDFPRVYIPKTPYTYILSAYLIWIIISITFNNNLTNASSIFELVKLFKVITIFIIIYYYFPKYKEKFVKLFNICFWLLLFINLFQFLDPFSLNNSIWRLYISDTMLPGLILNHRICGLMGNPNVNGILFLIFTAYFLSNYCYYKIDLSKVILSVVIVILTQSRTDFIALILIIPFVLIVTGKLKIKNIISNLLLFLSFIILIFSTLFFLNSNYISSLWNVPIEENKSILVRIETWELISNAIQEKPILGYGGNKDFFYSQGINADSQYVFTTFIFGFGGLIIFLLLLIYPFFYYKKNKNPYSLSTCIICIALIVTSFTNAPLSDYRIFIIVISFIAMSCVYRPPVKITENDNSVLQGK